MNAVPEGTYPEWKEVLEGERGQLDRHCERIRRLAQHTLERHAREFALRADERPLTAAEVDNAIGELYEEMPQPLENMIASHPNTWGGVVLRLHVLTAELLELRARVASLEGAEA